MSIMDKEKSLKRNYAYNLSYQLLAILVPLVTTPYVTRVLGPEKLGDYAYTSAMVSYFGIVAALGTVTYAQREVACYQKAREERSRTFYEILFLRLFMVGIVFAAYCVFLFLAGTYRVLYIIQLCTVLSWAFDISWFFQGMEDFKVTVIRNSTVKLISVILILTLVKSKDDLWIYAFILCFSALLGNMTMWPFIKKYLCRIRRKELHPLRHLKGSLELFVPVLSIQIYTVLDQTMLGAMINTTQVGYYAQTQKIINLESSLLFSLTSVLMPRMTVLLSENKVELANSYYRKVVSFGFMLNLPMTAGTILISKYLIPVFFGRGYRECIPLLRILSFIFVTQGIGQIAGTLLIAMKRQKQYTVAVTAGAVINLICNGLFITRFEAKGVAAASVFSEICIEIMMLHFIRPTFEKGALKEAFFNYLPPTLGMSLVLWAAECFLEVNLISLFILGVSGVGVYSLLLILRKDIFLKELLRKGGRGFR